MKQILVVLPLEYLSIFMLIYRDEHFVDCLSNNFEFGSRVCSIHHTTWFCKLNHHARPCRRLSRYLKMFLLNIMKGYDQDIYISCA